MSPPLEIRHKGTMEVMDYLQRFDEASKTLHLKLDRLGLQVSLSCARALPLSLYLPLPLPLPFSLPPSLPHSLPLSRVRCLSLARSLSSLPLFVSVSLPPSLPACLPLSCARSR